MKFSNYLDTVIHTEEEKQLKNKIIEIKKHLEKAAGIPIFGKYIDAIIAFGESKNTDEFKQTTHYAKIKDWSFRKLEFNGDFGFSFSPGKGQFKKAFKVIALISLIICGLILVGKCKKSCPKAKI